jgi:TonB family protein
MSLIRIVFASFTIALCLTTAIAQDSRSAEVPQLRHPGHELESSATRRVQPKYPALAKAARVGGPVEVEVTIDETGNVMAARALSGHPLLRDAALAAARQWKFLPAMVNSRPVKVIGILKFTFDTDNSKEIELLNRRIADDQTSADLRFQLGQMYLERGEPDKAVEPFKQSISLDSKFAKAYVGLGHAYLRTDKRDLAIEAYQQAARVDPNYAEGDFYLGMLYWREDRHSEAVEAFNRAVKRDDKMLMAYVGLGRCYGALGRLQEAVESLKQAAKIKPDSLDAHVELGEIYVKLGDKEAAMNEYGILKGINPFLAERLLNKIKAR